MRSALATVLTSCALVLTGCEKKASAPPSPTPGPGTAAAPSGGATPGVTGDTILIGEVGSLTGSEATFGISTRNAIELAVREVNAAGGIKGKKVEVRVYDNQSKPEEAASAANRLINQDQVLLILGEVASSNSIAMAQKAQPAKVPMISPASTNPDVTEIGDYIFRICFIDPFQGDVMAKFARNTLGLTTVAMLPDVGAAYSGGWRRYSSTFTGMGGQIVAEETYTQGEHRIPDPAHRHQAGPAARDLHPRLLHRDRAHRPPAREDWDPPHPALQENEEVQPAAAAIALTGC